jgi:hypothetical protein
MDRWSLSVLAHVVARWTRGDFALFLEYDEAELLRGSMLEHWTMECPTSDHHDLKLHGFYPASADTSDKAQFGPKGVSWPSEGSSAKSSSARQST